MLGLTSENHKVVIEDTVTAEARSFASPGVNQVELYPDAMPTCP